MACSSTGISGIWPDARSTAARQRSTAPDRVRNIEVSGFRFRPDPGFKIGDLLGGAWLSEAMRRWEREGPSSRIRMSKDQARLISQDWYYRHATFLPDTAGTVVLSLPSVDPARVLPLVRWLGPGAEILEPAELRAQMQADLTAFATRHSGPACEETEPE